MTAALFIQALFAGLTNGFVYDLVGLGIAVIFKGSRTVNVVQGEFVVIGAFIVVGLLGVAGLPFPVAALGGIAGGVLLGGVTEMAFIRPLIPVVGERARSRASSLAPCSWRWCRRR